MAPISRRLLLTGGSAVVVGVVATRLLGSGDDPVPATTESGASFEVVRSDKQWREQLTPRQYDVLREQGTERPYSSPLDEEHRDGSFSCAACDRPLFSSVNKFDSGTGWPSFWQPIDTAAVGTRTDRSFGSDRVEVHCSRCGGHQGHVFTDGPQPTGLRYCMNGVAMTFAPTPT